ncbi:hypothetical protein SAMN05444365_10542 [Micromonospora pattaloongensis]|uniref:Uncharacterized protein n=1 Tax=Micromonospora pattaloongensis TaxID=405436 RepID=A0A1H3PV95_9ACTN|nr:hypothetical protein SAMN05444365_10542 [Micromonospora pattaloongensis]
MVHRYPATGRTVGGCNQGALSGVYIGDSHE